jgi:hypothetical protein
MLFCLASRAFRHAVDSLPPAKAGFYERQTGIDERRGEER